MRNWAVAKNWQMRNYLMFYASLPGDITRNWVVAYGIAVGAIAVKVHPQQTSTNADIVKAKAKMQLKSVSVTLLVTVY